MEAERVSERDLSQTDLSEVSVRPIRPDERQRWDQLMRQHHYLGFSRTAGRALRQVAEWRGQWVGLLLWQACALMCAPRDRWIGWARPIQFQRLHLVANNARFLILPDAQRPHLASRVLGLSLRRLSQDWQQVHGHPVLLAETFVDPSRFAGTCYRAANWQCLGQTLGYARHAGQYRHHGQPKTVWVYPLHPRARAWLRYPLPHPSWTSMQTLTLTDPEMETLHRQLRAIPEPRGGRRQLHRLATVLTIALAATLAGARGYLAMAEFAGRLTQAQLKRLRAYYSHTRKRFEAPSEPTIRRVLSQVDPQALEQAFADWVLVNTPKDEALAIDGKTLKGARAADGNAKQLLAALFHHSGTVLAQAEVPDKTNEIPTLRELLKPLPIEDQVITADALHTQHETARFLVEDKQAHYLLTVKQNQPTLLNDLQAFDWSTFPPSAHHGR